MTVAKVQMQFVIESHSNKMFTKSSFKIYDLTNHSTNESICPLFSYTAVLVGVWLLFEFFLKWTASRIAKPMVEIGRLQTILVSCFFYRVYALLIAFYLILIHKTHIIDCLLMLLFFPSRMLVFSVQVCLINTTMIIKPLQ